MSSWALLLVHLSQVALRALGFEPKKEELKKLVIRPIEAKALQ